jgi:hypothetical protein
MSAATYSGHVSYDTMNGDELWEAWNQSWEFDELIADYCDFLRYALRPIGACVVDALLLR